MSKHTAGPWRREHRAVIAQRGGKDEVIGEAAVLSCLTPGSDVSADAAFQEEIANACLFAAAPGILEACWEVLDAMVREDFGTLTLVPKLRKAIAKAMGEAEGC